MTERDAKRNELIKEVIYLYLCSQPYLLRKDDAPRYLFIYWDRSKTLQEYPRPRYELMCEWYGEVKNRIEREINHG